MVIVGVQVGGRNLEKVGVGCMVVEFVGEQPTSSMMKMIGSPPIFTNVFFSKTCEVIIVVRRTKTQ